MEPVVRCLPFELEGALALVQGSNKDQKLAELVKTFLDQSDPKRAWKAAKNRSYSTRSDLYPEIAFASIMAGEVKKAAKIADQILVPAAREPIYRTLIEGLIKDNQMQKAETLFFTKMVIEDSQFSREVETAYIELVCGAMGHNMPDKAVELFNKLRWDHRPLYFHRILKTLGQKKMWSEGKAFIEKLPNMQWTSSKVISEFNQSALLDNS